jgi:hypothetical protein
MAPFETNIAGMSFDDLIDAEECNLYMIDLLKDVDYDRIAHMLSLPDAAALAKYLAGQAKDKESPLRAYMEANYVGHTWALKSTLMANSLMSGDMAKHWAAVPPIKEVPSTLKSEDVVACLRKAVGIKQDDKFINILNGITDPKNGDAIGATYAKAKGIEFQGLPHLAVAYLSTVCESKYQVNDLLRALADMGVTFDFELTQTNKYPDGYLDRKLLILSIARVLQNIRFREEVASAKKVAPKVAQQKAATTITTMAAARTPAATASRSVVRVVQDVVQQEDDDAPPKMTPMRRVTAVRQ